MQLSKLSKASFVPASVVTSDYNQNPSEPQCDHRAHCCYNQWMQAGPTCCDQLQPPAYLSLRCPAWLKSSVAKFRLNNAPIRCNIDHQINYQDRICTRCTSNQVDNEHHVLFECSSVAHIRAQPHARDLLAGCNNVHELMQAAYHAERASKLVNYISSIMDHLDNARHHTGSNAGQM